MKLCKDCKHYAYIEASKYDAASPRHECRGESILDINYITGEETTSYHHCALINTDGECKLYEEKNE